MEGQQSREDVEQAVDMSKTTLNQGEQMQRVIDMAVAKRLERYQKQSRWAATHRAKPYPELKCEEDGYQPRKISTYHRTFK
jgi:hypothetical protein